MPGPPWWAALWLFILFAPAIARADETAFKVGVAARALVPAAPYDWRSARTQALRATIWYPATDQAREEPQWIGPPFLPLASAGSAARDAEPATGPRRPVVVLSHGFGGTALDLAWLGTALAAHGFVVVAVDHPGTNGTEDRTPDGYALMWLRAVDISATINALLDDPGIGRQIDPDRIGAAGHSLGGYTVITVAGGRSDPARLQAFCRSASADALCTPSRETLDLRDRSNAKLKSDEAFQRRYSKAGDSYRDERVKAVFAMAPGPVPIFTPESLGKITIPVAVVTGSADEVVPPGSGANFLAKTIPRATLTVFPNAGHFAFFAACTAAGQVLLRPACIDPSGVDRAAVQAETIRLALDFFAAQLR